MKPSDRGALSVNEAAEYIGVSRRQMYRLSAECGVGDLPVVRIGGRRVFRVVDLDAYLARHLTRRAS